LSFATSAAESEEMPRTLKSYDLPPDLVLAGEVPGDPAVLFGRKAPFHLELGGGRGSFIEELASAMPEVDFLVNELKPKLAVQIVARLRRRRLENVRILVGDARRVVERRLHAETFDRIMVNHPDPWPKRKHAGRRLLVPPFLHLLATRLKMGGDIIVVSDVWSYIGEVAEDLEAIPGMENAFGRGGSAMSLPGYPRSHYQMKEEALGRPARFLRFLRTGAVPAFKGEVPRPLGVMPDDPDFQETVERLARQGRHVQFRDLPASPATPDRNGAPA
jgi:tRNA (guanine-N7-)-methyltransferase